MNQKKNIKGSPSCRDRIDYTVTTCLYCWYLWISGVGTAMENRINHFTKWFVSTFLPERCLNKLNQNIEYNRPALDILYRDLEDGQYIRIPKNIVYFTCWGYVAFPITIVVSLICTLVGWYNIMLWKDGIGIVSLAIIVAFLICYCASKLSSVLDKPRVYISYFKEFKKEDGEWLKKWKRYTILLNVGSLISSALSFGFCLLCIWIYRNIHGPLQF